MQITLTDDTNGGNEQTPNMQSYIGSMTLVSLSNKLQGKKRKGSL